MAESSSEALLQLELRLLCCSFSPPTTSTTSTATTTTSTATTTTTTTSDNTSPPSTISQKEKPILLVVESVINSIEKGNYLEALSFDAVARLFATEESFNIQDDTTGFYSEIEKRIDSFILQNGSKEEDEKSCRALLLMSVGVAALLAFTQNNLTGPCEAIPSLPLPYLLPKDDKTASKVGAKWDMWARNQLMSSTGSDLLGKFSIPQYILYAKMLLTKTKDMSCEGNGHALLGARSISWWLSRALLLQQRILNELSSSLFDSLQVLIAETLKNFGKLEDVKRYWGSKLREGEASTIVSMAHLEAGIVDYTYSRVDSSRHHFNTAEKASGLQLSVTGVLGFRTLHQVEATAQMVLVANTVKPQIGDICLSGSPELQQNVSDSTENKLGSHSCETFEASDILMTPKLVENGKDGGVGANGTQNGLTATIALEAIQQAVILARCLIIEKNTPYGEMQRWDMAPFIEAVDAQVCSYFIIQCFCDILRVRWESTRSRTKERALMMMDKLVQNVYESFPGSAERIHFSYGVYLPTVPALRKEYGELLVSCGMIGEALKLFEDLELWDNLIHCYCLLEKKAAAVELIKARLCVTPNDPRLWCSLGDVTNTDSHYEKALEVSNNRSARAKRSLARSAYNKGEYEASKVLWESAMALNSLYPDGWFALGAAALKARDIDKALDGFTRAVQLDPDNGEAWNNIGCLHMIKKKNKESFIAFKEALKFRRNNWELWLNLSQVAVDIQNFGQALEATKMVLDLTNSRSINANVLESIMVEMANVLERIMAEMESRTSMNNLLPYAANGDLNCTIHTHPGDSDDERKHSEINLPSSRETDQLVETLGRVLQQIIRSGKGEKVWGLYARWHKIKGHLLMCSEALLKQVRSYQGADLWSNRDRFKKYVSASLQLCEVYMAISLSTGSRRELNSAEMHLRSAVKQAVNFSEMDEFKSLEACLDEVRKRLQSISIPSATIL